MDMSVKTGYTYLKNRFLNGIEYHNSLSTYCKKTPVPSSVLNDTSYLKCVVDMCKKILEFKANYPYMPVVYPDVTVIRKNALKENCLKALHSTGQAIIPDTMRMGMKDPFLCISAWYDAIAEWVIAKANSQIGTKPPIHVINEESGKLTAALMSNKNYLTARENLAEKMKSIYPKTYKIRMKSCENSLNKKIQNAVRDIVKNIVKG